MFFPGNAALPHKIPHRPGNQRRGWTVSYKMAASISFALHPFLGLSAFLCRLDWRNPTIPVLVFCGRIKKEIRKSELRPNQTNPGQTPLRFRTSSWLMDARLYDVAVSTALSDGLALTSACGCTRPFHTVLHEPDVHVLTSSGLRIPAHSGVLASASPVLENSIDRPRKHRSSERVIPILGVPCGAVSSFVGFLYSSRCSEEQLEKYGIHLLALSHVYLVPQLKHRCTKAIGQRLTEENVVDVLQLARLCDAPDLYLTCMKLAYANFNAVEKTEAWKFLQDHDPWLELQILRFIDEAELRKKNRKRHKEEQSLYLQLSEAMECLQHIFSDGCTIIEPFDMKPTKKEPCIKFATCQGVQLLIKHFASCDKRANNNNNGGCSRCKRMWQLLRLHSSICDQPDCCRVPLCRQFKMKAHQEKRKKDEIRWKLLVKKVWSAKVMSSLSQPKRKRAEEGRDERDGMKSLGLSPIDCK